MTSSPRCGANPLARPNTPPFSTRIERGGERLDVDAAHPATSSPQPATWTTAPATDPIQEMRDYSRLRVQLGGVQAQGFRQLLIRADAAYLDLHDSSQNACRRDLSHLFALLALTQEAARAHADTLRIATTA